MVKSKPGVKQTDLEKYRESCETNIRKLEAEIAKLEAQALENDCGLRKDVKRLKVKDDIKVNGK